MMRKGSFVLLFSTLISISYGQVERHQTIRGKVIDAVTGYALIGANVILLESDPVIGTSTDLNGSFILENIQLGRQGIEIRYVGYVTQEILCRLQSLFGLFSVSIGPQKEVPLLKKFFFADAKRFKHFGFLI